MGADSRRRRRVVIVAAWLIIPISALLRKHDWKESGFRFDNFLSGLVFVGVIVVASVAVLLGIAALVGVRIPTLSAGSALRSIFWGLVQEAVLLGYFFQRWRALLRSPLAAAAANSLVFGLFHAPDMALVSLASFGSFFFGCFSAIRMSTSLASPTARFQSWRCRF